MPYATQLQAAIARIKVARQHTGKFIEGLSADEWFWHPDELTTHIAWQVGHLAVAQYNLCLRRVRGRPAEDESLMPDSFFDSFKLGSIPVADPARNPPLEEIRRVFDAVHQQALSEFAERSDAELDEPVERPHPMFTTKLGAVEWCSQHELIHAGQIGLLRRLMGKPPLR